MGNGRERTRAADRQWERGRERGREGGGDDEIISIGTSVAPGVQIVLSPSE